MWFRTHFVLDCLTRSYHCKQSHNKLYNWHADSSRRSLVELSRERITPRISSRTSLEYYIHFSFILKLIIFIYKQLKRPVAFSVVQGAASESEACMCGPSTAAATRWSSRVRAGAGACMCAPSGASGGVWKPGFPRVCQLTAPTMEDKLESMSTEGTLCVRGVTTDAYVHGHLSILV